MSKEQPTSLNANSRNSENNNSTQSYQIDMDPALNIIPGPIPDICESAHERLFSTRHAHVKQPGLVQQSKITIKRNAEIDNVCQNSAARTPISSDLTKRAVTRASTCEKTSFPQRRFAVSTERSPLPTSSKKTSTPRKLSTNARHEKIASIPSCSYALSNMSDNSSNGQLRASTAKPASPRGVPSIVQKRSMSKQAAETVRVTDWAISLVKAAEKRVREEERAAHEKEACELRLRLREAEMKTMKLEKNDEKYSKRDEASLEGEWMGRRVFWKVDHSEMGRFENLMRDAHQQCRRGLAVVLER